MVAIGRRLKRWQKIVLGVVGGIIAIIAVIVIIFTQTNYGRSRFRTLGLNQLAGMVHGIVKMGDVHGNLLSGATIEQVVITDSAGNPFLRADTLSMRYSLRSLLKKHIVLQDVRLVRPVVVLNQPPGDKWNFQRLFPGDSLKALTDTVMGFGDWLRIEKLTVVDGDVSVRRSWAPAKTLNGKARDEAIRWALSSGNHEQVVRVTGGFQNLSSFRKVNGFFPLIIWADPDSAGRLVEIARMSMIAQPFKPPAADVRDLKGRLSIGADTVVFHNMIASLPTSKLGINGWYSMGTNSVNARVHADPVNFAEMKWANPRMPNGNGRLDLAVARVGPLTRIVLSNMDVRAEGAHVTGGIDLQTGPIQHINGSNLDFAGVSTALIEKLAPTVDVPIDAVFDGHMKLAGASTALSVDGWTNINDRNGEVSRVVADGTVGNGSTGIIARNLRLRFDPIRVSLLRTIRPDLPIGGVINGRATLNGNLSNRFTIDADVVHTDAATGRSHLLAVGDLSARGDFRTRGLRLRFDPVQAALLRAFQPKLELDGLLTGRATLVGGLISGFDVDADVYLASAKTGRSHVLARGGITTRNGFTARRLHLRFDPLQLALVRAFSPGVKINGTLTGRATISGSMPSGFTIDADVVHNDAGMGSSHVVAVGGVSTTNGFVARNLKLRFEDLQVALLKSYVPTLPIDGTLTGRATLNGSPQSRIEADFDVAHNGSTGTSELEGDADMTFNRVGLQRIDLNTRARPLSLATAGLFAPAAGLRGYATGAIRARGNRDNIEFTTDLAVENGGVIAATGMVALGDVLRYDVRSTLQGFDPSAISTRAPVASLTGTLNANGNGTDPATAVASIDAALIDTRLPGAPRVDTTRLVARIANGLATVDRGHVALASAMAEFSGSFGLIASQTGTLKYTITIDTLGHIADLATADTTFAIPRPLQQARRVAQARADSIRIAQETEVERAATGKPPAPGLTVDSLFPLPRDTVAGSLRAEGTVTGNIKLFNAEGNATLKDILFRGNQVQSGSVAYTVSNAPTAQMGAKLNANLVGVRAGGFGFDSIHALVNHNGGRTEGNGMFDLALFQDPARDYRIKSDFVLALDRKELRLNDLLLRFDSTVWRGTQPGTVSWAASGIALRTIDLRNDRGGHVFADGSIPTEGSGDLRLDIDSLQIGDIAALLQDTLNTRGILSLNARLQGTQRAPVLIGDIALDSAIRGGIRMPDLRASFNYANTQLTADAQLLAGVQKLLNANAKLPVDLAMTGRTPGATRLLDLPLVIDAHMDSLPLDAMPSITPAVQDVRGVVRGDVGVRGTIHDPQLTGAVTLELGSMRVVQPGIILTDGVASLSLAGKTVTVDSLVAISGGGPIRATGTLDVATLTKPAFDLKVASTKATLLNNHLGNIRGDVDIAVKGPFEAIRVTGTAAISGEINAPEQNQTRRATNLDDPTLANVLDTLGARAQYRGPNPMLRNMLMDVTATIARDTWVRNSTANVEIYTPEDAGPLHIRVDNAQQAITIEGTINADRGEYTVAGRQFKLTTGSITFLGTTDLDPMLQLSAQYEVPRRNREALTILINVGGYLRAPRLTLSSNSQPPLPQSDLISYLAFGRTSTSLLTPEGSGIGGGELGLLAQQQLAGLGLGAFTDALVRGFEEQGKNAGLDVFRIHPGVLPDELNFGGYFKNMLRATQIEAGQYLTPHLFAAVEGRATGTLPGLRLEYEVPTGWSWRATWEPRYLPTRPTLADLAAASARQTRVFGSFVFFTKRF